MADRNSELLTSFHGRRLPVPARPVGYAWLHERDLPEEVRFLESYDRFVSGVQRVVDMPARTVQLVHRFLEQNEGRLSKRARDGEFAALTEDDVSQIEQIYRRCSQDRI